MAQREPKQSQLDYLWSNFGNLSVSDPKKGGLLVTSDEVNSQIDSLKLTTVSKLEIVGTKLIGRNINNQNITEVPLSSLSTGAQQITGSETNSLILEVKDNVVSGRLKINNEDSLIVLTETDRGLKAEFSGDLNEQLQIIQNVSGDISELKTLVKTNSDALSILNGDESQEGSVLNLITTKITNAFNWQEI